MLEISFTVRIHSFVCHDCNSKQYQNRKESFPSKMELILFKPSEIGPRQNIIREFPGTLKTSAKRISHIR